MNSKEAIEYINSVSWEGKKPGLSRTCELLKLMANPEKKLKFIHIAGTNGKGSTAAMTAEILIKAGYKTGLSTSPSIFKFNERMKVNGEEISDNELAEIVEYIKPLAESMISGPTEMELITCTALEFFKRKKCDIVVLETGMGGELDSTNVIETPEVAVITNIGLDHTKFLGNSISEITKTKCGIIKENGTVVLYRGTSETEKIAEKICKEKNSKLIKADFNTIELLEHSIDGQIFNCGNRKNIFLSLLGNHQLKNASVVLSIIDILIEKGYKISEDNIRQGFKEVKWPGRFEIIGHNPLFIIDGGHNPQCINALSENIETYLPNQKLTILTGVLADKDYEKMYLPIIPYAKEFVCIEPPSPRKLSAFKLAEKLAKKGAKSSAYNKISDGVKAAINNAGKDGIVLCFGSLYMIADVKNTLKNQ